MGEINKLLNLFEYEKQAKKCLSQMTWDYYSSGAWDEITLRDNRAAFNRIKLRPRIMVDVSDRLLATTVLNQPLQIPLLIAPMAFQCLAHREGELATATTASKAGVGMVLSTLSTQSMEDVADAYHPLNPTAPLWFQLYIHRDRELTRALVERAYAAGYNALCVTVDAPVLGRRERDTRNQFTLPPGLQLGNLTNLSELNIPIEQGESGLFTYFARQLDAAVTWRDLEWLQSLCPLPLVIKGILRGDDAARAVECGAKAIIVSNHGGRQLDGAIASLDALAEVVAAVDGRAEVLLDGGIRRGTDVMKAIALGAKAVLIGRPVLWGLALAGEAGVADVIEILRDELDVAMALSGCAKLQDIDTSLLTINS
ncbi:alpha-hydroxy acid oxidase [Chlorogloeopsis sp. ULAP01]|uniref:alpha-hydroxy acid oxidase n=1 Tax=Chlorogloeopsis sp. ULAP01 TaxID=3056483 RepID=UPI0025AB0660|nr:alpha-hydroxy acid oxidase [Chlorogloeopsis sp. ULAP01]MDM9382296.1 alpha-hydroxy acid oxidase [Chlorogloeopsis sp. ULAP01]